ncbi:hypothetical protein [Lysobacter gummosus]|uniref:hypothetical protein n=1 Tax=Lysobacter gummosus TaxID=262324 RepID=UPI003629D11A
MPGSGVAGLIRLRLPFRSRSAPSPASGVRGRCLRAIGSRAIERPSAQRLGRGGLG